MTICDVTLRDGLQSERDIISTEQKLRIYDALVAAGVRRFEMASFVSPKLVPQMADAAEVIERAKKPAGAVFQALVPNEIGARRALQTQVDELKFMSTASESYTRKNQNRTLAEVFVALRSVVEIARAEGRPVRLGIGMAFDCPYEGPTPPDRVLEMIDRALDSGVASVQIADSVGTATAGRVAELMSAILSRWPSIDCGLHLHDNRGQALANALSALDAGCTRLDACLAGLGGTPVYAGSMGNICLEDLVYMLHSVGSSTGFDLERLIEAAGVAEQVVGHPTPGKLLRVGLKETAAAAG